MSVRSRAGLPASTSARAASQALAVALGEGAHLQRRAGEVAEALLQPRRAAVEPAARRGVLQGQVVEAGAGPEAEGHLLAELDPVEGEQVAQRGRAAVVAGRVDVAGDGRACRSARSVYPAPPMRNLDLKLLRAMRTRGHSPGLESVAKALGKAGNNGVVWVVLGLALALLDPDRREAWLICAALGADRDRPQLRDQAAGQGGRVRCSTACRRSAAPPARSASPPPTPSPPSRWRRRWSGSTRRRRARSSSPWPSRSAAPTWGCTTRPMSWPAPCSASCSA